MTMETPLRQARGLGSARTGAHHWWLERLSSVSTLLLLVWFVASLWRLPAYDHGTIVQWLGSPLAAVPMILLILSTFWHARMGLIVAIEDYEHGGSRLLLVVLVNFLAILGAALAIFAVLKIAFAGTPA
ncbi:succinate dehydrogenase, hydrophobic membrane anchor protein [Sphingosinicella sp.]|uniref:succinate dehydrogenase, hydrophobic membrane anchor protein n=1 Tax=Sphingosinicella sp. TaxID=1917971 RepID=UPI004037E14E